MTKIKTWIHFLAWSLAAIIAWGFSPNGQSVIHLYPKLTAFFGVIVALGAAIGVYQNPKTNGSNTLKCFLVLLGIGLLMPLNGCNSVAKTAYQLVVGAKAFTDKSLSEHPECKTTNTSTVCVDLSKAVSAKDTLIDALEVYCAGPNFNTGGACDEPAKGTSTYTQATAKLQAAIDSWNQASKDLKGVL